MLPDQETIPEFYANKKVFITGGTGFVRKVLIEKILRSCPDVCGIYCLIRPKRGKLIQERIQTLMNDQIFDEIRRIDPNLLEKLHPIPGDIMADNLGISDADREFMNDNINIVFHSAATIKFDEPMKLAIKINVSATKTLVEICRNLKNLISLVHVSTAYSNCDHEFIEELIYPTSCDPDKIIRMSEWMDEETLNDLTPKLIGSKPNTYIFTKQLTEYMLVKEASDLPLAIVRPSIVTCCLKEPFPGWIDNLNGPSGLYIGFGKGLLRTMLIDEKRVADIIPVDMTVNMLLAVGWYTAIFKPSKLLLYNCTSGTLNPVTWGDSWNLLQEINKTKPMEGSIRHPQITLTKQSNLYTSLKFMKHTIPAAIVDSFCKVIGKKPFLGPLYNKIHKVLKTLQFFTLNSWKWTHQGLDELTSVMNDNDLKTFYFDPRSINWPSYHKDFCIGIKTFLLKEKMSNIGKAHNHINFIRKIRYLLNAIAFLIIFRIGASKSVVMKNIWVRFMMFVTKIMGLVTFGRISTTSANAIKVAK